MHRYTGRFVEYQQLTVFKQDGFSKRGKLAAAGEGRPRSFRLAYRWQTYFVGNLQPVVRLHAPTIDPHLAGTQQPVHVAFGHALENPE